MLFTFKCTKKRCVNKRLQAQRETDRRQGDREREGDKQRSKGEREKRNASLSQPSQSAHVVYVVAVDTHLSFPSPKVQYFKDTTEFNRNDQLPKNTHDAETRRLDDWMTR
jgi:hypothetical protein